MNSQFEDLRYLTYLSENFDDYLNFDPKHKELVEQLITDDLLSKAKELNDSKNSRYDVLIITVIDVELEMISKVFKRGEFPVYDENNIKLYEAQHEIQQDDKSRVLIAKIGKAGNIYSTLLTERILSKFSFKVAVLCGIAAGVRGKIELGDSVISNHIYYYELEKLKPLKRVNRAKPVIGRSQIQDLINELPRKIENSHLKDLNDLYKSNDIWTASNIEYQKTKTGKLKKDRNGKPIVLSQDKVNELSPDLYTDREYIILSGEKLLADGKTITELADRHDYFIASEMEAAGFALSCYSNDVDWVIVRGITDFGDELKNDTFHYAASLSAAISAQIFVDKFLQSGKV